MVIRTSLTIGILTAWIQGGKQESTNDLMEFIKEELSLLKGNAF